MMNIPEKYREIFEKITIMKSPVNLFSMQPIEKMVKETLLIKG